VRPEEETGEPAVLAVLAVFVAVLVVLAGPVA
jgi:hypothetical protein